MSAKLPLPAEIKEHWRVLITASQHDMGGADIGPFTRFTDDGSAERTVELLVSCGYRDVQVEPLTV